MAKFSGALTSIGLGAAFWVSACGVAPHENGEQSEVRQPLSTSDETSTLLGFSLDDGVPQVAGVTELAWQESPTRVTFSPSDSTSQLEWAFVVPDDNSPNFSVEEVDVSCDEARTDTNTNLCEDHLEASLILQLSTEDGALLDELLVKYRLYAIGSAEWVAEDLNPESFEGSFEIGVNENASEFSDTLRLGAFGTVQGEELAGELVGDLVVSREGDESEGATGGQVFYVARWATSLE